MAFCCSVSTLSPRTYFPGPGQPRQGEEGEKKGCWLTARWSGAKLVPPLQFPGGYHMCPQTPELAAETRGGWGSTTAWEKKGPGLVPG